jgi:hypothetical protein
MASKLIRIEAPKASEPGADVVFVRKLGRFTVRIKACSDEGCGWSQWGAETSVLGDNVAAVEAWARGIREAYEVGGL